MQTKLQSLVESFSNVLIGYFVALLTQLIVFPLYGMDVNLFKNIQIGIIFTFVSILRSYILRRVFNKRNIRNEKR